MAFKELMNTSLWGKKSLSREEEQFLEGPKSKSSEFFRALRIFQECIKGFRFFHKTGPCVTFFGSARFEENHQYFQLAYHTAQKVGEKGFAIMTGGGPGIMEACNRGAQAVNAKSLGCNIRLPREQKPNPYLDRWMQFHYFFVRKLMLVKYSSAFVVLPGGFGTLDELFEVLCLVQTDKIKDFPIILMGKDYWGELLSFLRDKLRVLGTIDQIDIDLITLTDDPEEVSRLICKTCL